MTISPSSPGATFGALDGGASSDTLLLTGTGTGTLSLATTSNFETLTKGSTGTWTLSGHRGDPGHDDQRGHRRGLGRPARLQRHQQPNRPINVNGATIRAVTAGAFGTGTITTINPTIEYGATGTYANNIVLASVDPVNDPHPHPRGRGRRGDADRLDHAKAMARSLWCSTASAPSSSPTSRTIPAARRSRPVR
jgi:hypothetical protein